MVTVEVRDYRVFGFHGIYPGEEKTGGLFEINLSVQYDEGRHHFESLAETINYEKLVSIIQSKVQTGGGLLEKLALDIVVEVKDLYPQTLEVTVSVHKLNPPIENFRGRVGVTIHKRFDA